MGFWQWYQNIFLMITCRVNIRVSLQLTQLFVFCRLCGVVFCALEDFGCIFWKPLSLQLSSYNEEKHSKTGSYGNLENLTWNSWKWRKALPENTHTQRLTLSRTMAQFCSCIKVLLLIWKDYTSTSAVSQEADLFGIRAECKQDYTILYNQGYCAQ